MCATKIISNLLTSQIMFKVIRKIKSANPKTPTPQLMKLPRLKMTVI